MTTYGTLVSFGCIILACIIPGVSVVAALLIQVWWNRRKAKQASPGVVSSPVHPYRAPPSDHVWRFVKVHVGSAWLCAACGAGLHDDCDERSHRA